MRVTKAIPRNPSKPRPVQVPCTLEAKVRVAKLAIELGVSYMGVVDELLNYYRAGQVAKEDAEKENNA